MIPLLTTSNSLFPLCTNTFQNILNSHNNITNVLTIIPSYTWVKWNRFLAHTTSSLHKSNCAIFTWMQVSVLFGAKARKCRENLQLDHKRFETWLIHTGHVKTKGVSKLDLFEHIRCFSSTKSDKCFSCYLSEQVVCFQKQIIVLFWVIIYSYLQRFFKVGVLKTLSTIHRKTTVLDFASILLLF